MENRRLLQQQAMVRFGFVVKNLRVISSARKTTATCLRKPWRTGSWSTIFSRNVMVITNWQRCVS